MDMHTIISDYLDRLEYAIGRVEADVLEAEKHGDPIKMGDPTLSSKSVNVFYFI